MLSYASIRYLLWAVILLGLLSIGSDLAELLSAPASITILTKPLEKLREHHHATAEGDSLLTHGHVKDVLSEELVLEHDTWITGMKIITNNAPMAVVHHMHLFAPERKDAYCPVMPEMLMDVGQDAIPFGDFPPGYGLFLPKGTKIQVNAALHNPDPPLGTGEDYHDVSVGFTLHVDRFGSLKGLKPLSLHIISLADQTFCTATTFTVPPHSDGFKKVSLDSAENGSALVLKRPGTIVALGAHIHAWEGGENLLVYKNNQLIKTFLPEKVETNPDVWRTMPDYEPVRVEAGDRLTISSQYANPYDVPIVGAMGMAAFFIHYDEE